MALEVVSGAFLSASFQEVFRQMGSGEVMEFLKGKKHTDRLLKKLKIKMLSVDSVLRDAEEKQLTDSNVKQWLDELKEAVYDAEDLLMDIKTEALRHKMEADHDQFGGSTSYKVQDLISASFHAFDHTTLNSRIEEILESLEFIVEQKDALNLKTDDGHRISETVLPSTSLVESDVYGRDEEKESFIKLLLSDDVTGNKISVVPIVGMGGIGKTTFAHLIYNDDRVKQHFDIHSWVCVSQKFDVLRITQTIYESITEQTCDIRNLDMLQCKLKEALTGKKFLFVHDDIWNENYIHWDSLRCPFESCAHGSKIIVTTRNQDVATMMSGTLQTHRLTQISEEDCWLLFAKHAFENASASTRSDDLEVIGRKIARKCNGLPLAAKSLGGLLRSKLNMEEWEQILKSEIWEFSHEKSKILPALWLSYNYLPSHLKRCFAYCSIFPKNYTFKKSKLVVLWKAEGLLEPTKNQMVEEVGNGFFDDLTSRSFFQTNYVSKFIMHDLINDLAKFVSGEFCVRWGDSYSPNIVSKTRHFSYIGKYGGHGFKNFQALYEAKYLRTFLPLQYVYGEKLQTLDAKVLHDFFSKLQYLRVLNLAGYDLKELPNSIGKLNHLRHLDLSYTLIEKLPDTVCTLYNLQTLLLSHCKALTQLPTNLGSLINLRHLDIKGTKLQKMPVHMGKLKDLRMLNYFVLDKHSAGHDILELKELRYLRGTLGISGLCNLAHAKDALEDNIMRDKKHLDGLVLEWESSGTDDSQKEREREVLEKLQPHTNLKQLKIYSYRGTRFPSWLGHHSSCNLVSLQLMNCVNCLLLPPLGQLPSLKELHISGLNGVGSIGPEFCGDKTCVIKPFRSLQVLIIEKMCEWQEWYVVGCGDEGGVFPNLCKLILRDCVKLTGGLPLDYFPKLQTLKLSKINLSLTSSQECKSPKLFSLRTLDISYCPNIVFFPDGGLDAPNLTEIAISRCDKLRSLPEEMHSLLSSLESLYINNCPELESFPEGGLPSTLKLLGIISCKKMMAKRIQWGLPRLTSLTYLELGFKDCEEVVDDSFPEEGLLPTTLKYLWIQDLLNVKKMDGKGFRHLNSLQTLWISTCPKLQCLPDEGLPNSLSVLYIYECPFLSERCEREKGEDWPKIAHIPTICIDG